MTLVHVRSYRTHSTARMRLNERGFAMRWIVRIALGMAFALFILSEMGCGSPTLPLGSVWVNNQSTSNWLSYRVRQQGATAFNNEIQIMPPIAAGETDRHLRDLAAGMYEFVFTDDTMMDSQIKQVTVQPNAT